MAEQQEPLQDVIAGERGAYQWISAPHEVGQLLDLCPQTVVGKYVAITVIDSGVVRLSEDDRRAGWTSRGEIAYSPRVRSIDLLHMTRQEGFQEWYIFAGPTTLGGASRENVFEPPPVPDVVMVFAHYYAFALHNPKVSDLTDLFWRQLEWIQPESYVADGSECLTFVTRNHELFESVHEVLKANPPTRHEELPPPERVTPDLLIAERHFFLEDAPAGVPVATFRVWKPYQPPKDCFHCPWEWRFTYGTQQGETYGIDAFEALISCLSVAGSKIAALNQSIFEHRLRWARSPEGARDLGLPTMEDHWPFREIYESAKGTKHGQSKPH